MTRDTLGGRSYCPNCRKTLAWYELLPLVSFLIQRGHCRGCGALVGWSYPAVELVAGFIVALVPLTAMTMGFGVAGAALWTAVFLVLLLITLIDIRLQMIPDELSVTLAALGIGLIFFGSPSADTWIRHVGSAFGAAIFFAMLIFFTRNWGGAGQGGMGIGDAKLAFALGLVFGWPGILLLIMLAFIIGAMVGVALIAARAKNMKSALPFGPFLAFAALVVFLFGQNLLESWYNWMI